MSLRGFEERIDSFRSSLQKSRNLFLALGILFFTFSATRMAADPDLFARMAMGRLISESGSIPTVDPFAFTPKKPLWIDHEWLSGVVFYKTAAIGGDAALILLKCALCLLTIFFILKCSKLRIKEGALSPLWILLCLLSASYLWTSTIRSQVFTYLFLSIYLFGIESFHKKRWPLLVLPLLMAAWVNFHGGFTLGLAVVWLYAAGLLFKKSPHASRSIVLALLVSACTFITPYSPIDFWRYMLEALTMPRPSISEWESFSITDPNCIFILLLSAAALFGTIKSPPPVHGLLLILVSGLGALLHIRFIAFYSIILSLYAVPPIISGRGVVYQRALYAAWFLFLLASLFQMGRLLFTKWELSLEQFPVEEVEWLRNSGAGGKLLVDFNSGSYALWQLYPKYTISLDGRYEEVYPQSTVDLVSMCFNPTAFEHSKCFEMLNPDAVIVHGTQVPEFLTAHRSWCATLMQGSFTLLLREKCER